MTAWLCITNFQYYYVKVLCQYYKPNLVGMKWYATIVWHGFWSHDHEANQKHITTFTKVTVTKLGGKDMRIKLYHGYMSRDLL